MTVKIEDYIPGIKEHGLNTDENVVIGGSLTVNGDLGVGTDGLTITNNTAANSISVDQNGDVGSNVTTDGAIFIENTGNAGIGLAVYTNVGASGTGQLVYVKSDNAAFTKPCLRLDQDGDARTLEVVGNNASGTPCLALFQDASTIGGNQSVKIASARTGGSTVSALEIAQTGTSAGIYINHDANANAINIDHENTTVPTINVDSDILTTAGIAVFSSASTSNGTRSLVKVANTNAGATGTTPLEITQTAPTSTNYFKIMKLGTVTIWQGNGTTANGTLSGTAGDILFNGGLNKPEYCTGGTAWAALV